MKSIILFSSIFILLFPLHLKTQEEYGGFLRYIESEFPRTFDPITSIDDGTNDRLSVMMFESLFNYNIYRDIQNKMAESYTVSADNRSITVVIKQDARWSDGTPVTAHDVKRTIEAIQRSENMNERRMIQDIRDVTVVDDNRVTFQFRRPLPENVMLHLLTFKVLNRNQLSSLPLTNQSEIAREPIVSGFYEISRRGPNLLSLRANKFYRSRRGGSTGPYIDEVTMYIVTDRGTQVEYLQSDQVDLLIDVPPELLAQLRASGFQMRPYESLSFQFIAFNFRNNILQNADIRHAMVYGFARENALDRIFQRQGDIIGGPYPPGSPFYTDDIKPFPYDPFKAIELLEESGFSEADSDGTRENDNGERLEFDLVVPRNEGDDYGRRVIAQFISDMRRIGIKINVTEMEFGRWVQRIRFQQNFDLAYATLVFDEVGDVTPFYYSEYSIPGGDNFISYDNPVVDELIKRLMQTTDHHEKVNINRRLHRILRDDCPYIYLWSLRKNAAANQRVRNFMTRVTPYSFFDYINEWYIRE